jgi:hypothetical protein
LTVPEVPGGSSREPAEDRREQFRARGRADRQRARVVLLSPPRRFPLLNRASSLATDGLPPVGGRKEPRSGSVQPLRAALLMPPALPGEQSPRRAKLREPSRTEPSASLRAPATKGANESLHNEKGKEEEWRSEKTIEHHLNGGFRSSAIGHERERKSRGLRDIAPEHAERRVGLVATVESQKG